MSQGTRTANRELADRAVKILGAEHPMTLRQLHYRCLSAGVLEANQGGYHRLGRLMTRLRERGDVPRSWIVDHLRSTLKPSSWSGLGNYAESVRACYRLDFWPSMPHYVEVLCEKDAIAGTLQPITEAYDVPLRVVRGYASVSFAGEIAAQWAKITKPVFAYYIGDFDPSGFDIERDLRQKLERYAGRRIFDTVGLDQHQIDHYLQRPDGLRVFWRRLGVVAPDFDDFDLLPLAVKPGDRRAAGFIDQYGTKCAEVDALPPDELRRRVEGAILDHVDAEAWGRLRRTEEAEKETLAQFVASLPKPKLDTVPDA